MENANISDLYDFFVYTSIFVYTYVCMYVRMNDMRLYET